jgi:hypothetical protein
MKPGSDEFRGLRTRIPDLDHGAENLQVASTEAPGKIPKSLLTFVKKQVASAMSRQMSHLRIPTQKRPPAIMPITYPCLSIAGLPLRRR